MHSSRLVLFLTTLAALSLGLASCGGGGGSSQTPSPPPPAPTVTVSASPTEVASGSSSTLTVSSTNASSCSMSDGSGSSQSVTCNGSVTVSPTVNTTYTVTATGDGGSSSASATVTVKLAITVAASSSSLNTGDSVNLTATAAGGDGNATIAWTANPAVGSFSSATGTSTTWTAPTTLTTSPETVTLTATATDGTGSDAQTASANASVTVTRVITLGANLPDNELFLDFGGLPIVTMTCSGCEVGDVVNIQAPADNEPTFSQTMQNPDALASWPQGLNFTGYLYTPTPIKVWITGTDGAVSNTLWLLFDGSQNEAVQDPSTGMVYYYFSGDASIGSGKFIELNPDGTTKESIPQAYGAAAIAFDGQTIYITQPESLASGANGIVMFKTTATSASDGVLIPLTNGEPGATSASNGLVCATIPTGGDSPNTTDAVDCNNSGGTFTLPGIPPGSEPAAIKVLDANNVVVLGRGDSTLRWYTISGTAGTAAGTLQLSGFTNADAAYWKEYPITGGWDLAEVGSTLAVMGEVVNGDGTVSQKLALVNATTQKLIQYVDLPQGTIHIAADSTNNAVVAEYPDFTVSPPIMRLKRFYVDTGNSTDLASTSTLIPGAGFVVDTWNGVSKIVVCDDGKCDFQPNQ